MPAATLTTKGQITIPKAVRESLGLNTGDKLEFVMTDKKEVLVRPVSKKVDEVFGKLFSAGRKPVSVEEMDKKVKQRIRKNFK